MQNIHNRTSPSQKINIGFVGLGYRAEFAITRFRFIPQARISGLCDINPSQCLKISAQLSSHGYKRVKCYDDYREMLTDPDIDLIYISTPWHTHARIAIDAMNAGKHTAIEVPAAMTISECEELVSVSEKTGMQCSILENCCYDEFTLATQNMIQDGLFGEIYHCEGAYIHRLCERMIGTNSDFHKEWMPQAYMSMNGNIYPTHGFGPIAMAMNINRGDRIKRINSVSSKPRVYNEYVKETFGKDVAFKLGDVSSSIITTESGKIIELQFDIASPRPYNRKNLVVGTNGMFHKYPTEEIALKPDYHQYITPKEKEKLLKKYMHPVIIETSPLFQKIDIEAVRKKGILDYAMDYRLVKNLTEGKSADLDVYDAATWSCIVELSALSASQNGTPVDIPDFTNGLWRKERISFQ
ncbi:MAG: Gfo/Idh/MocA family protein [Bacteroidales bacterium]